MSERSDGRESMPLDPEWVVRSVARSIIRRVHLECAGSGPNDLFARLMLANPFFGRDILDAIWHEEVAKSFETHSSTIQ